ncbi:MAG: hypothetical protein H8F28_20690 [Fibrella sp.]|nr:hypothetical protein [Armatimonadota bacterium]
MGSPPQSELTIEERAAMDAWLAAHPYGEQDENGIDLSNIRRNLRLTPTERLARLQSAANSMIRLRNAIARN